ncbi:hypothetical protein CJF31_00007170 [Rutstroemia sp. NJR-2017a BVV2]|nr:hypothetical protein CJF31_00007170 [Rutstroemia sp. NJR-2017a BVV2]
MHKSQLAIEYAYRVFEQSPETWVFWIHASNAPRFKQGFQEIADLLKIPGRENAQANIFQLVRNWLLNGSKSKWLVILDNVDDARFLVDTPSTGQNGQADSTENANSRPLEAYIPHCGHGSVLITSRTKRAALKLVDDHAIVTVEPMNRTDALILFKKKLERHSGNDGDSDDNIMDLVEALDCMPLAIVQAAAYISRRAPRCSIRQYLEDFLESDSRKTSLLEYKSEILRRDPQANNSIITTWQISFDHIREIQPSAADLLSLMSFFDRQGIPEDLLRYRAEQRDSQEKQKSRAEQRGSQEKPKSRAKQGKTGGKQKNPRKTSVIGLSLRSLFNRKSDSRAPLQNQDGDKDSSQDRKESNDHYINTPSSHHDGYGDDDFEEDIVVLRDYSFISANNDQKTFEMHRLVQLATRKWLEAHNEEERWKERFIKSLESALPESGKYENWPRWQPLFPHVQSSAAQRPLNRDVLLDWASVLCGAASYATDINNYGEAEKLLIKALEVRETLLGRRADETLQSMSLVGGIYYLTRQLDAAAELQLRVLETRKQLDGVDGDKTLHAMFELSATYVDQSKNDAAEQLLVQAKTIVTGKYGPDNPFVLALLACLSTLYKIQGRLETAEQILVEVLNSHRNQLGTDHPETLENMASLGRVYLEQERFAAAEELFLQVLATRKMILKPDNPETLYSKHDLACVWSKEGRLTEAIALMKECIQSRTRVLGPEHPDTLDSYSALDYWRAEQEKLANKDQSKQGQ